MNLTATKTIVWQQIIRYILHGCNEELFPKDFAGWPFVE